MKDSIEGYASNLDLDASKVSNYPALVLLCGGPLEAPGGSIPSFRKLLYERLQTDSPEVFGRVLLAEDANEWSRMTSHYDDLLELEDDLACLSAVVMVLVESPGSIAELGAFCRSTELSKRLVAVLEFDSQEDSSFIQNGPVDHLRKLNANSVYYYPWLGDSDSCGRRPVNPVRAEESLKELHEILVERARGTPSEEKLHRKDNGHLLLLIADLIEQCTIVLHTEIDAMLKRLGVELTRKQLARFLFLLEKLRLIDKTKYGHRTYYLPTEDNRGYVRYAQREGAPWDRQRAKARLAPLLIELDPSRKNALALHQRKKREASNG